LTYQGILDKAGENQMCEKKVVLLTQSGRALECFGSTEWMHLISMPSKGD